jgi:VCBS repeat-containing protein
MGNHSSPNNVNAQQTAVDNFYIGKLSLTMTGYWKINLQLQNDLGTIVKGEEITDSVTESSLFFEIEF